MIVRTPEGIIKARDFKRHPSNGERWNIERFSNIRGYLGLPSQGMSKTTLSHISYCQSPRDPSYPPRLTKSAPCTPQDA